jgi:hypothetical protein
LHPVGAFAMTVPVRLASETETDAAVEFTSGWPVAASVSLPVMDPVCAKSNAGTDVPMRKTTTRVTRRDQRRTSTPGVLDGSALDCSAHGRGAGKIACG